MFLLFDLVNYCHSNYSRVNRCDNCENECRDACEKCLEAIHFKEILRRYNCQNIVNYYTCKHIFRYSSEIDYLFQKEPLLNQMPFYNILSIGCGPASDLFGIINNFQRNGVNKEIKYNGCDMNRIWQPIHEEIKNIIQKSELKTEFNIIYNDIFDVFDSMNFDINIIFLQYLISDMVVHDYNIIQFFINLIDKVIANMDNNAYIIINDVNHRDMGRDYFDTLISMIRENSIYITCDKYHFEHDIKSYYRYGQAHQDNKVSSLIPIPRNIYRYNPWEFCASAQLLIKKR